MEDRDSEEEQSVNVPPSVRSKRRAGSPRPPPEPPHLTLTNTLIIHQQKSKSTKAPRRRQAEQRSPRLRPTFYYRRSKGEPVVP